MATGTGVAQAADNLPPKQPLVQDLQTGHKACAAGDDKAYVSEPPTLTAVLYDPEEDNHPSEANMVKGEFEAWWTDSEGVEQRLAYTTNETLSGSPRHWRMPEDGIPPDTVVSWRVRANDGTANSPWSSEDGGSVCEFVYDDDSPEKATIASPEYPEDVLWVDGVGVYGHFTMDSPSDDVVAYAYGFIGGPHGTVRPERPGGPVTIPFVPLRSGPDTLTVRALDHAGRSSGESSYRFFVKSGRAPVGHWPLADAAGATSAHAEAGPDAGAGSGVTFGAPAPAGTALTATATLDGSSHGYLTPGTPAVADPRKSFAVSAWARPAQTDRNMTVASQDAGESAGPALGLSARGESPVWSFSVGGAQVSGGTPEIGEWAHLLGVYDAETGKAQLYVNGRETGTRTEAGPTGTAGAFQIGRTRDGNGYHDRWHGEVGGVRVHDRVVVPAEAAGLAHRKPLSRGHWSLETVQDGASPERNGGAPLKLGAGATIFRAANGSCLPEADPDCPPVGSALVGDGHLTLDGEAGHAVAQGPVVDTSDSFTIGVIVRLADAEPGHPMTVLSVPGEHTDALKVRYQPEQHAWQLVMPHRDERGAPETVVAQMEMADGGEGLGHRLAVVYDDATDKVKLYLDGTAGTDATADLPNSWRGSGPLQIGRGRTGEYLRGDVDEVQAFAGAFTDDDIWRLGTGM
ncbi:LamG domain-containing protein [Streptomyces sp. NEAU-H22]|uniref:LamG domain-containing protein n=1 Tax=unclassified Streptomyces TaxID=2593676 RepID=UPI00225979C9|nr:MULTISPECIES: LamG domain-containing protein [unclassified Streptomyces]MCX3288764.1 LamG domain-containing protein [Streptomyces sp. NEAU-H22]WMD10025.1 LamG domain-containing protein [Streptomyces sp. FXY-T5]